MELDITCPSGLAGVIRPLKVKDEALYTDLRLLKDGTLIQELCKSCWVNTTSLGPYNFDGPINWDRVLQGDAFWVFLQIRIASYGSPYTFKALCQNCGNQFSWTTDLAKDLKIKKLPPESAAALKSGKSLSTTRENGKAVAFRLLLTEDERAIAQLQEGRKVLQKRAALMQRLVAVDGEPTQEEDGFAMVRFVEELDAGEADYLLQEMEKFDCGIDTDLKITCEHCLTDQVVVLPFEVGFFSRQLKK
jgi:hypothetical protein